MTSTSEMSSKHKKKLSVRSVTQAVEGITPISLLLSLPAEIICCIFGQVEKADLKSARLSCKSVPPIIDPILFREVIIFPH
jgi:hypothetical protein